MKDKFKLLNMPRVIDHVEFDSADIDKLHEFSVNWAIEYWQQKRHINPIAILKFVSTLQFLELEFGNEFEKAMTFGLMRAFVSETPMINLYSFITEAWASSQSADEPLVSPRYAKVKDDILFITSHQRGGESLATRFLVGKRTLGPRVDMEAGKHTGAAWNWFDPDGGK